MPDIATISTFLGSLKTATELAKAIKGADLSLEKAETKLKMAELISALADAKIQAVEIQDLLQEKDEKIKELEKAFKLKSKLVFKDFAYFQVDGENNHFGEPLCSYCWDQNQKAVKLTKPQPYSSFIICPNCKNTFSKV
ncbi:MAG: hypothetical protein LUM44_06630 [Pyrinomonadaceae bacterium]|nr:hypothetical protein [Pyrinomonadaceae bacterium]